MRKRRLFFFSSSFFLDKTQSPQKRINSCSNIFFKSSQKCVSSTSVWMRIQLLNKWEWKTILTMSDAYFPQVVWNGTLDGIVSVILPSRLFLYPNGDAGLVQSFIVLDEMEKWLVSSIWHYKITAWNEQAENLNVMRNRTYHFSKYKLKPTA